MFRASCSLLHDFSQLTIKTYSFNRYCFLSFIDKEVKSQREFTTLPKTNSYFMVEPIILSGGSWLQLLASCEIFKGDLPGTELLFDNLDHRDCFLGMIVIRYLVFVNCLMVYME